MEIYSGGGGEGVMKIFVEHGWLDSCIHSYLDKLIHRPCSSLYAFHIHISFLTNVNPFFTLTCRKWPGVIRSPLLKFFLTTTYDEFIDILSCLSCDYAPLISKSLFKGTVQQDGPAKLGLFDRLSLKREARVFFGKIRTFPILWEPFEVTSPSRTVIGN